MKIHYKKIELIDNAATGASVRAHREKLGKSLRRAAADAGISAPYLSDLERGHRAWSPELFKSVKAGIEKL
jgi:transcriptional regulator with XRE-family HTH domain